MQAPGRSGFPDRGGFETRRKGEVDPARASFDYASLVGEAAASFFPRSVDGASAA